jgi:outer membrane protein assembly factor BamA
VFYDPAFSGFIDRDLAQATRTVRGGSAFAIYPLNKYRRLEASIGLLNYDEQFNDPALEEYSNAYQQAVYGTTLFRNGTSMPLGAAFVQETTVFREFGPLKGSTMRLGYEVSPPVGNMLSRQTFDGDARYYLRLGGTGLLAMRVRGFKSIGDFPDFMYFGGNSEMRGYEYLEFVGHNAMFANVELRFPLIEAMLTPLGVLGGVRGVAFANVGGAYFEGSDFKFFETNSEEYRPIVGYQNPITGDPEVQYGPPVVIDGLRLRDARGSYGIGLETFALGFPIHFDWAWRTLFNKDWEDALFFAQGGSEAFRKPKFSVWIGYDF